MSTDDPRDASKETKQTLPRTWATENIDVIGSSGMLLSGLVFVTKNRVIGWGNLLLALSTWVNAQPMRTKDGGMGGLSNVGVATLALFSAYLQAMTLPPSVQPPL